MILDMQKMNIKKKRGFKPIYAIISNLNYSSLFVYQKL